MKQIAATVLVAILLVLGFSGAAMADAAQAKATGQVGERLDGYLGIVDPAAPASVQALVNDINARRRAAYQQVAADTGQTLTQVEAVAGARLIQQAAPGTWVMNAAGVWIQR